MALVTITGDTVRDGTGRPDNRAWTITASTYQDGEGGVITSKTSTSLYPVAGVLTFQVEAGITAWIRTPDEVSYLVRIPESNANLWALVEAGIAYPPTTSQDMLNAAVSAALPPLVAVELDEQTAEAIDADLAAREITFTDSGGGEGYFSVGGVAVSGTLVPPAATWSGVAARPSFAADSVARDGSTDDHDDLAGDDDAALAADGLPLMLRDGVHRVASNLTIDSPVWFLPGAIIKPDSGVTVTLAGGIVSAPMSQVADTSAGGTVKFKNVAHLYPQWWGATGDGVTDDTDALQAALAAASGGGTVLIPLGTYTYAEDLVMPRGTVLRGLGKDYQSGSSASRLLATHADARIRFDDHCHIQDLLIDGGGVANWALQSVYVTSKPSFQNVFVDDFAEAAFVFDGSQNGILINCTVRDTPIAYAFYNGVGIFDLYSCSYENYGTSGEGVGGADARAVLIAYDTTDDRLNDPPYQTAGAREIKFWGGIYEYGSGEHYVEILNSFVGGQVCFNGTQIAGNADTLALMKVGSGFTGDVVLSDCIWSLIGDDGSALLVDAAGGRIRYRNQRLTGGQGRNLIKKTALSGTATAHYDELSGSLINSTFDTSLVSNESYSWAAYTTGTGTWNGTKKCMDMTMAGTTSGVFSYFQGAFYSLPQYQSIVIRFRIANATGPVRLSARLSAGGPTTLGVFGNGSHTVVHELGGLEVGLILTSDSAGAITAELNYFRCEYNVGQGGSANLTGAASLNFSTISAASYLDLTITVAGAMPGDAVALGVPTTAVTAGVAYTAWVSAADTVTVRAHNYTAGTPNPDAGTFRVAIIA